MTSLVVLQNPYPVLFYQYGEKTQLRYLKSMSSARIQSEQGAFPI